MRWWDWDVRARVGLVGLNLLALAVSTGGAAGLSLTGIALLLAALLVRSIRCDQTPRARVLQAVPTPLRSFYLGEGYEWTVEALQETLESGRPARRSEQPLLLPESLPDQHVLVLGTTGVGKTRMLELLALQAIARGDSVIVVDPKGDAGLLSRVRSAAGARFQLFSLPHPEKSEKYNPLARFRDVREVADRVASLLPSSGDALPFRNFGWEIIHTAAAQLHPKSPITFRTLKRAAIDRPIKPLSDRPREHHLKMASALVPLLAKLSGDLLCPERGGLTWEEVDRERQVVYFDLGALLGQETASAVAKTAVMDLQSYIGARYAYGKGQGPMWLLVDELGDVLTDAFVGLLNKSRGAGLRIVACAQTLSDLEASLGGRARALQIVGNVSTVIQFRSQGQSDAEAFAELSGERMVRMYSEGAAYEPALLGSGLRTVDDYRARFSEAIDWREHALVPPWTILELPTLEFFARWGGSVYRGRLRLLK